MDKTKFYMLEDGRILTKLEAQAYINNGTNLQVVTKKDVEIAMRRSWVDLASTISELLGEDYGPAVDDLYHKAVKHLMELHRYKTMFHGWYQ